MPLALFQSPQERAAIQSVITRAIGRQLQQVFDEDLRRPLDDRFIDCLRKIDEHDNPSNQRRTD